jgi:tetratricopeptide (TPR) repeat protein
MHARGWLTLAVLLAWATSVHAAGSASCPEPGASPKRNQAQAKELFEQALRVEPSDPARALDTLRCAETLAPRAAIALRIGTIAERLDRLSEAADAFERYLELAGDDAPDAAKMGERIRKLRARVKAQELPPEPEEPAPDGDAEGGGVQSVVGWVAGGTGLALGIVGVALLGAAKAHSDSVQDLPPGTTAWSSDEASGTIEQAELEQTVGIVGLVVGGALLGLGAVLILTDADGDDGDDGTEIALVSTVDGRGPGMLIRVQF